MAKLALNGGHPIRHKPYPHWPQGGLRETSWLNKVLASRRWFAGLQGDDPEALGSLFGKRFAALHGSRFGLPVANGSVAIEIALRALGVRPGDEVIVPSYTFISTATSVLMVGAVPVFADIEPNSYCLDPQDMARRIGPNTRVVLPVHLGGQMADMPAIMETAKEHQVSVVEDCAQAIGSSLMNKGAGNWGDLGTFSFQSNKTLTAGEGGLVMTNNPSLAEKVVAFRAFGRFKDDEGGVRSSDLTCRHLSSNYRLSEFQSAVLLAQLEKFQDQDDRRQANAARLTKGLNNIPGVHHVRKNAPSLKHGYYYYLVRYKLEEYGNLAPARLCAALNAEGIPFVPGDKKPLYRHPVFEMQNLRDYLCPDALERYCQALDLRDPQCPTAEEACKCTIILRHQVLLGEPEDMDDIIEAMWKIQKNIDELQ